MINIVIGMVFTAIFAGIAYFVFDQKTTYIEGVIVYFLVVIHSIALDIKRKQEE